MVQNTQKFSWVTNLSNYLSRNGISFFEGSSESSTSEATTQSTTTIPTAG